VAAFGLLLVGVSGAVAALGNTLYPDGSLADGLAADLSPTSHVLIRLRILHPTLAVLTAGGLVFGASRIAYDRGVTSARLARAVAIWAGVQLGIGALNVVLLAPIWMQLVHLLVADGLWITFVLLGATALAVRVPAPRGRAAGDRPGPPPPQLKELPRTRSSRPIQLDHVRDASASSSFAGHAR
jgi:cytochrome c oxidase assembly protein subunit 15